MTKIEVGTIVSGKGIQLGRFEGEMEMNGQTFYRVMDIKKKAMHFVASDNIEDLRTLPSENTVREGLKIFTNTTLIESGEVEGSRFKFFKNKLDDIDFENSLEVLHDLIVLHENKEISSSERKLLTSLKEKMIIEMKYILNCKPEDIEKLIEIKLTA